MSALTSIFEKYVTTPTRIPDYGPNLNTKVLLRFSAMFAELRAVQNNLSFAPIAVKQALEGAAKKQTKWKLSDREQRQFASTVGKRIRDMCRHISQNMIKSKPPKWISRLQPTV